MTATDVQVWHKIKPKKEERKEEEQRKKKAVHRRKYQLPTLHGIANLPRTKAIPPGKQCGSFLITKSQVPKM